MKNAKLRNRLLQIENNNNIADVKNLDSNEDDLSLSSLQQQQEINAPKMSTEALKGKKKNFNFWKIFNGKII